LSSADDNARDSPNCREQLELILDEYLKEEDKHRHSSRAVQDEDVPLKIELF
jgi:hypothetical protein